MKGLLWFIIKILTIVIAIQILNFFLIAYQNRDSSFVLGAEALVLTILGCSYFTKNKLQLNSPKGGKIDIVNVLALSLSIASVFVPWVLKEQKDQSINHTYMYIGIIGFFFFIFDMWYNYNHPQNSVKYYASKTRVREEFGTITIITEFEKNKEEKK